MVLFVSFAVIFVFVQRSFIATVATNTTAAQNLADFLPTASCGTEIEQMSKTEQQQFTRFNWRQQLKSHFYDTGVPPQYPDETIVNITVQPVELSSVDEYKQTLKHKTVIELWWNDPRLAFQHQNVCAFPYQNELIVPMRTDQEVFAEQQEIWIPKIHLSHRQTESGAMFLLKIASLLVFPNGTVSMFASFDEVRSCDIKAVRYPFDVQICPLMLVTLNNVRLRHAKEENEKLIMKTGMAMKDNPQMLETNEWSMFTNRQQIIDGLTKPNETSMTITYTVYLTRKYEQHVVNWIASPIVLSVSCVVGMFRGCNVGERFSFGGAIVVAITLMVNELRNVLGVGGDGYPILGQLYLGLEMTLILATLMSGLPQRWHDKAIGMQTSCMSTIEQLPSAKVVKVVTSVKKMGERTEVGGLKTNAISGCIGEQKHCLAMTRGQWDNNAYDWLVMGFILMLQATVVIYVTIRWIA